MADDLMRKVGLEFQVDGIEQASRKTEDLAESTRDVGRANDQAGDASGRFADQVERDTTKAKGSIGDVSKAVSDLDGNLGALGGAAVFAGATKGLDSMAGAQGRLQAQLNLTAEEAERVGDIAQDVFTNNFGESLEAAGDTVALVKGSMRDLSDDGVQYVSESVLALEDAFGGVGADAQIMVEDVRAIKANFPGMSEVEIIDLIASGFQSGAGNSGDLQDTLQEYPGDFSRIGLSAEDMFGIIEAGAEAGIRNTDILADGVREMAIRIVEEGGEATDALNALFPADEAERLRADFAAGGEAGRDAFFDILGGLEAVEDPIERNARGVQIMGTKYEDAANQMPAVLAALHNVEAGTNDATGAAEALNAQYENGASKLETFKRQLTTGTVGALSDFAGGAAEIGTGLGTAALGLQGLGVDISGLRGKVRGFEWGELSKGARIGAYAAAAGAGIAVATAALAHFQDERDRGKTLPALEDMLAGGSSAAFDQAIGGVDGITTSLDTLLSQDWESKASRTLGFFDQFGGAESAVGRAKADIEAMEGAILSALDAGDRETAGQAFDILKESVESSGGSVDDLLELMPNLDSRLGAMGATVDDLSGSWAQAKGDADGLAGSVDRLNYSDLADTSGEAARQGDLLASTLRRANSAAEDGEAPTRNLRDAVYDEAIEFRNLEEAASSVEEALDGVLGAKDRAAAQAGDLAASERGYMQSQEDLNKTLQETTQVRNDEGDVIEQNTADLRLHTQAGRDNDAAIWNSIDATNSQATAQVQAGDSIASVNKRLRNQRDDLVDALQQFGVSEEAAREYADEIKLIPNDAKTRADLNDAAAREQLGKYVDKIEATPDYAETYGKFYADRGALESWLSDLDDINRVITTRGVFKKGAGPSEYAEGTPLGGHPGGPAIINERGPELVSMPRGSVVTPTADSVAKVMAAAGFTGGRGGVSPADIRSAMDGLTWRGVVHQDGTATMQLRDIEYS